MTGLVWAILGIAVLYWLPGAGLADLLWPELRRDPRHDRLSRFAVSVALSLAVRPLLVLWCSSLGVSGGAWLAWAPGGIGAGILLRGVWRQRRHPSPPARRVAGPGWVALVIALVVVLTVASRWLTVRALAAPAWGDSVHHSILTQLLIEHRGLFQSWAPYAPMQSLTYHFGFHAMAAAWSAVTGASAPDAVLWVGQLTGVAAVLSLYPLTLQLTDGKRAAGAGALLFAGLLSPMPAFYASWGRYTQLAGQALLPVFVALLDVVWIDRKRSRIRVLAVLGLLASGLYLTHYRVALLAATAAVVWPLAALWQWRAVRREWIGRAASILVTLASSVVAVAPWLAVLNEGLLFAVHGTIAGIDPSVFSLADPLRAWSSIPARTPIILLAMVVAAGALGLVVRDRAVLLTLSWSAVALLATNPFVLGLPGMGFVTNFAIAIAAYIPAAVLLGWGLARCVPWFERQTGRRAALVAVLVLAALATFGRRAAPVGSEFQLVTDADLAAFEWIREHTPPDAHFAVNAALAYGGKTAVGTDAGWWLPLYTRRTSTLPPLTYTMERMNEKWRHDVWALIPWLERTRTMPAYFERVLCRQGVTHLFLGDKRGSVGVEGEPLLSETLLRRDPRITLRHQVHGAQVWSFDRSECPIPWPYSFTSRP